MSIKNFRYNFQDGNAASCPKMYSIILLLFFTPLSGYAQGIEGKIVLDDGTPAVYAHIQILNTTMVTTADADGKFKLDKMKHGDYLVRISFVGYASQDVKLHVGKEKLTRLNMTLQPDHKTLETVEVSGKSEVLEVRQQAFSVSAISAVKFQNSTMDLNQLLNRTTGVRVREEGGVGSSFNFSLNGFSGNQVKFFLDGIPMDNFGSSLTLNNIPVNAAERIEVYKGVVPVWLGSDALGGAVNVVTNQKVADYLDVSYSFGSFNTHQASVMSRVTSQKHGVVLNTNAFINYSDNNYRVKVQVPDPITKRYGDPVWVERFHDNYQSGTVQVEGGLVNKPYADKLLAGLIVSGNLKEIQNGMNMEWVAGQVRTTDNVIIPTLKYKKEDAFAKGLSLSAYASYNMATTAIVDSSSRDYDWLGNYTVKVIKTSGEISWDKTLFKYNDRVALTTVNASYQLNDFHSISFNHTFSKFTRTGEDPISRYPIPFEKPNILAKNVLGLSYKAALLEGKLSTVIFAKYFQMTSRVVDAEYGDYAEGGKTFNRFGYGFASTYFITPGFQVKASAANTARLPEGYEVFGNGLMVENSPNLKPETSTNVNAGMLFNKPFNKHRVDLETGFVYRLPKDMIRPHSDGGPRSSHINQRSTRVIGVEAAAKYSYSNVFDVEVNGTYQNIVNTSKYELGQVSYIYLDKIPNLPYLFGNATVNYRIQDLVGEGSALSLTWSAFFVEAFYLKWPSLGSADGKYNIPQQFSQSAAATYSVQGGRYNISLECRNITDSELFDNFRQQKPGRSFSVKLHYFMAKAK